MIKKIVELQKGGGVTKKTDSTGKRRSRPSSASSTRACQSRTPSYVANPLTGLAPGGNLGVPTAEPHPLYTRHSATMTHHFEEQNDIALNFVPGKRTTATTRQRTQVQILSENRKILQRILTSKTTFSRAAWQSEERERRKLLENISRFSHLKKRPSSGTHNPTKTPSRTHLLDQDSHVFVSTARQASPPKALVVVDHRGGNRLEFANVICTGSPVTHLRHRPRPLSASAATRPQHEIAHYSDWHQDSFTRAMSELSMEREGEREVEDEERPQLESDALDTGHDSTTHDDERHLYD